ncbi:MAG: hypothetical protein ABIK37_03930 [candidate division WOR-3 bacterium]
MKHGLSGRNMTALLIALAGTALGWWDMWPYYEHQDLLGRTIDICAERYPDMAAELSSYRSLLLAGVHDEDFDSDEINGSYSDYSGYCVAVPDAWWPTARRHLNAIQWVHDVQNPNNWTAAVATYPARRSDAYYMLGHILHNLQDLFVPAHAHISPHGLGTSGLVENHSWPAYFDNFEQYCEVTSNELNRARADRIPEASLDTLMVRAARFASTDVDSAGFSPSLYYAPPDQPGAWGRYRPYPYNGYPCGRDRIDNNLANTWSLWVVPACCEITAAAVRAFYLECNPTGVEETPPDLSRQLVLTSPARPGAVFLVAPQPATFQLISADGRIAVRLSGSSIRCPVLPDGTYLLRAPQFTRPVVIARR